MISEDPNSPTHSKGYRRLNPNLKRQGNRSNLRQPTDTENMALSLMMFDNSHSTGATSSTVSNNDTSMNPILATPITMIPSNATVSPVVGITFYECNICEKIFSSYQALGGHKTKHRKSSTSTTAIDNPSTSNSTASNILVLNPSNRPHECSTCHKIFLTGQALGGHKTKHRKSSTSTAVINNPSTSNGIPHECSICHKIFLTGLALDGHKRLHRLIGGGKKTTDEDVNEILDGQPIECGEDINERPSCGEDVNEVLDNQPLGCDEDMGDLPSCDEDIDEVLDDQLLECDEDMDDLPSCDEDIDEVLDNQPLGCDEDMDDRDENIDEVLDNQPLGCDEDMDDLPSCDEDIDEVLDDQLLGCDEDNIGGGKGSNIDASGQGHCDNNVRDFDLNMPAPECDENIDEVLEDQPLECDIDDGRNLNML